MESLPELRPVLTGLWSLFSIGTSEAEADDDWDDTDSLLPIDVSSVVRMELSPTADTYMKKKGVYVMNKYIISLILCYREEFSPFQRTDDSLSDKTAELFINT